MFADFWNWIVSYYDYLIARFWATELEITLLGLQNAGKTSLLRVLAGDKFTRDSIPTVGFSMQRVKKGSVVLKCWDVGGQPRFRTMWERYCLGVDAIVFVVDSADAHTYEGAKQELHGVCDNPLLSDIPVLVLANKNDLAEALPLEEFVTKMDIKGIKNHQVTCYSVSVKEADNLNAVVSWLVSQKENVDSKGDLGGEEEGEGTASEQ